MECFIADKCAVETAVEWEEALLSFLLIKTGRLFFVFFVAVLMSLSVGLLYACEFCSISCFSGLLSLILILFAFFILCVSLALSLSSLCLCLSVSVSLIVSLSTVCL